MVSAEEFRDGMSLLGAAVNVIASDGPAGRVGFTASAVCSVSDAPPTLLVCVNRASRSASVLRANRVLSVNTLSSGQRVIGEEFSRLPPDQRFVGSAWTTLETGSPILEECAVAFDCVVTDIHEKGTHSVFYAEVVAVSQGAADSGLYYFKRRYVQFDQHTL